jgi:histidine ammonia-lyase
VDQNFEIYLEEKSWNSIKEGRLRLLEALKDEHLAVPGINRGYGWFNRTKKEGDDDAEHQLKTLRSNLVSFGEPLESRDCRFFWIEMMKI